MCKTKEGNYNRKPVMTNSFIFFIWLSNFIQRPVYKKILNNEKIVY